MIPVAVAPKLEKVHFNKGNRVRYRMTVTAGLLTVTALSAAASAGAAWAAHIAVVGNLIVSIIWVWE